VSWFVIYCNIHTSVSGEEITTLYKGTNILPETDAFSGIFLSKNDLKNFIFA